jgi:carbamoyl-phosphate synthase large subunit
VSSGDLRPVRVLVTGAGGPAAVSVMKSLRRDPTVDLIAADLDPWAAGLYLVPPQDRTLVPAGSDPAFVATLFERCLDLGADVVVPTVDTELRPVAQARAKFADAGIEAMLAPDPALAIALDKLVLARHCAGHVRVPRTEELAATDPASWCYPVIVKPRRGSGSRDISLVHSAAELAVIEVTDGFCVQEYLPGEEYSIDVLAAVDGHVVASVPRVRERVDSGVSVAGRTVHDDELERFGSVVMEITGLTYIANVQCRRDRAGQPALLEVNARVPGTLPLTVASGVDMPRLALDSLRGRALPDHIGFREIAMVRYLDEQFVDLSDVRKVAA